MMRQCKALAVFLLPYSQHQARALTYLAIFAPPFVASRMRPEAMVPFKTPRAI
jgi:hypothetical protein